MLPTQKTQELMKMSINLEVVKRIVLKVGSSTLTGKAGANLDPKAIDELVDVVSALKKQNKEVIVVSSGAIAAGLAPLGLTSRPSDLTSQQAAASVGQGLLMAKYTQSFNRFNLTTAQILITLEDITKDTHVANIKGVLESLLKQGVVPVINENDTVGTEEIKYGDNDGLAARVTKLVAADLLVLITDIDGLYDANPSSPGAKPIHLVADISKIDSSSLGGAGNSGVGSGGMITKIEAAKVVTSAGIGMLLSKISDLEDALSGKQVGTYFLPNS
jgi:glutamate 5-kinase